MSADPKWRLRNRAAFIVIRSALIWLLIIAIAAAVCC